MLDGNCRPLQLFIVMKRALHCAKEQTGTCPLGQSQRLKNLIDVSEFADARWRQHDAVLHNFRYFGGPQKSPLYASLVAKLLKGNQNSERGLNLKQIQSAISCFHHNECKKMWATDGEIEVILAASINKSVARNGIFLRARWVQGGVAGSGSKVFRRPKTTSSC